MNTFEEYWQANIEKYKALALIDYGNDSSYPWRADISIDDDDDFTLDINNDIRITADSHDTLISTVVERLTNAKFKYVKTWSMTDSNGVKTIGDYSHVWYEIRDEAIGELRNGQCDISLGGNQTIDIVIWKPKPD